MLHYRSHWHFAFERDPFGEARLLAFAGKDNDGNSPTSDPSEDDGDPVILKFPGAKSDNKKTPSTIPPDPLAGTAYGPKEGEQDLSVAGNIEDQAGDSRGKIGKTLSGEKTKADTERGNMRERFKILHEKASKNALKIQELKERMDNPDIIKRLREYADAATLNRWLGDIKLLNREAFYTTQEKDFAMQMETFWNGQMSPQQFLNRQRDYLSTLPYGFQEMAAAIGPVTTIHEDRIGDDLSEETIHGLGNPNSAIGDDKWDTLNQGTKIEVIDNLLSHVNVDQWLNTQTSMYTEMEKVLQGQEEFVEQIEKQADGINVAIRAEAEAGKEGISGFLRKIRWRSINDYLNGIGKYWNAVKSAWETRSDRVSAGIARNIGKAMKGFVFGEEVDEILSQQLDAKDNEEEEAMSKSLTNNHATWGVVFGRTGIFQYWSRINPNKARGCLSWAADHGFLYDLDDNLDNPENPIYGIPIADICSDWAGNDRKIKNYFTVLRNKNSQGRDHEKEHGLKTEKDIGDVSRFIALIEHEMHEQNLWATAGICERAMQRGLNGEVAAYLYTTIMSMLRHDPALRKVTPVSFFDIVGKLSAFNTAFTLGWMHIKRRDLKKWASSGDDFGPPDETLLDKTPLKFVGVIEREIIGKKPSLGSHTDAARKELNELTAKVLSGSIVVLPGGPMHIFESRFKPYRDDARKYFAAPHDPLKEDPDFSRNQTEKMLLPEGVFKTILDIQSTNFFKSEAWVQPFLGSFISMEKQLGETPGLEEAHKNFCDETRYKFDSVFTAYEGGPRVFEQLNTRDTNTNKPAIASLIAGHLLSFRIIENTNEKTAILLKQQLDEYFPEFNYRSQEKHPEWNEKAEQAPLSD